MAHNEDNDIVDYDDQHDRPWQPRSPSQISSSALDQCNVLKPIFSLGTLTAHCLTDMCVFACRFTT
jgi:hypothetical protein